MNIEFKTDCKEEEKEDIVEELKEACVEFIFKNSVGVSETGVRSRVGYGETVLY